MFGNLEGLGGTVGGRRRVALAWVVLALAGYALAFVLLEPVIGVPVMSLALVVAALAGWWLGAVGGGLAVLVVLALNAALTLVGGDPSAMAAVRLPGAIAGGLVALACGVGVGAFRQRHALLLVARQRLREQLVESEGLAAALAGSEQRFRLLAEEALVGVYLIQDEVFQYVNPAFAEAFGYEAVEIMGRLSPDDLTLPEDRPLVRANIDARLERGTGSMHYRFRGLRKDGSGMPVEARGRVLDVGGRLAILGTLQDRTKEAQAEAELRLRLTVLEAAPIGIAVVTPDGVIAWANPFLTTMTGYSLAELKGSPMHLFQSGKQDREFYQTLWETIAAGRMWDGELVNRRKDGSEYYESERITPVQGPDGGIEQFVVIKQDITERHAAEQSVRALNAGLEVQLARITALHHIDRAITQGDKLDDSLTSFLQASRAGLGVDAVAMFLLAEGDSGVLELAGALGFRERPPRVRLPAGAGVAGRAAASARPMVVHGRERVLEALLVDVHPAIAKEDFEAFVAAPMLVRGRLRGALVAGRRAPLATPEDWLEYFTGIATQGAILVDNTTLLDDLRASNEDLRAAYDATIEGWSRALDLRDKETEGHSRRVTELTLRLAHAMGFRDDELLHVRRGALLHDIGKMGVPDAILQKPGKLTEEEWAIMRRHTTFARDLLTPIAFLAPALDIPYAHHERWDGSGYPEGLKGEDIPLPARLFAIADVYDALTSDRPYRPAWSQEKTLQHIRDGAGSHFDPRVVTAFLAMQSESTA